MTIDEAIDRNVELRSELKEEGRLEKAASVGLGIEALKRERKHREGLLLTKPELLPGETEETKND